MTNQTHQQCSQCGQQSDSRNQFCGSCGARFQAQIQAAPSVPAPFTSSLPVTPMAPNPAQTSAEAAKWELVAWLIGDALVWAALFAAFGGAIGYTFAQRLFYSLFWASLLTGIFWVGMREQKKLKATGKPLSMKDALARLPVSGFQPTQSYIEGSKGIALDEGSGRLCFLEMKNRLVEWQMFGAADVLESEVTEDGYSVSKTSTGSMAGRAVLGGLLLGPLGAVVGGATAKKKQRQNVKSVDLHIVVNDTARPIRTLNFMKIDQKSGSFIHKVALEKANHWQALISVLIRRAAQ